MNSRHERRPIAEPKLLDFDAAVRAAIARASKGRKGFINEYEIGVDDFPEGLSRRDMGQSGMKLVMPYFDEELNTKRIVFFKLPILMRCKTNSDLQDLIDALMQRALEDI